MQLPSYAQGFTLIELVTVIAVLAILTLGTTHFLTDASQGYATTMSRTQLASGANIAVGRMVRELKNALPNSVRTNTNCIEFIPIAGASSYLTLAPGLTSTLLVAPFDSIVATVEVRAAIFPLDPYTLTSSSSVSPVATITTPDPDNQITLNFATPHQFQNLSPTQRIFLVSQPVSFCINNGALFRYANYGFIASQPAAIGLPASRPQRAMLGGTASSATPFSYQQATLVLTNRPPWHAMVLSLST